MSSRTNSQFVVASVQEFMTVWAMGGDASLNLTTNNGLATVSFTCHLGHPGAPNSPPSSSTPSTSSSRHPRHRGPTEKERNRQRAAHHQAARTTAIAPVSESSPSEPVATAPVMIASPPSTASVTISPTVVESNFKCDLCDFETTTQKGLNTNRGHKHRAEQLREEEQNISLDLSLTSEDRDDSFPAANSTIKDPMEEEGSRVRAHAAIETTKADAAKIENIDAHIQQIDPVKLRNMTEKELSDLKAEICRKVKLDLKIVN